jgi:hypothetical protein
MFLARLREHCDEEDLIATTRRRRGWISGFDNKQNFLSTGIQKRVKRCEKCIAKDDDYVEKASYVDLYI